jgi:hypothetical protein
VNVVLLLVFQIRFVVSEVAAILQVVLEAMMLWYWYVVRVSNASSSQLAKRR